MTQFPIQPLLSYYPGRTRHRGGQPERPAGPGDACLATLAYRIASYWLPLLAGPPAYLLFRHRYGKPTRRTVDHQGADADPEHDPRGRNYGLTPVTLVQTSNSPQRPCPESLKGGPAK